MTPFGSTRRSTWTSTNWSTIAARVRDGRRPATAAAALAAGRHDLLPGWYDDWVLLERERLRQLRLHMLEQLAGQPPRARGGTARRCRPRWRRWPPSRCARRRTAWWSRIHLAEGNAFEAVHAFYVYRDLLLRELRLEPSPAMCALLDETLGSDPARHPPGPAPPRSARAASPAGLAGVTGR